MVIYDHQWWERQMMTNAGSCRLADGFSWIPIAIVKRPPNLTLPEEEVRNGGWQLLCAGSKAWLRWVADVHKMVHTCSYEPPTCMMVKGGGSCRCSCQASWWRCNIPKCPPSCDPLDGLWTHDGQLQTHVFCNAAGCVECRCSHRIRLFGGILWKCVLSQGNPAVHVCTCRSAKGKVEAKAPII